MFTSKFSKVWRFGEANMFGTSINKKLKILCILFEFTPMVCGLLYLTTHSLNQQIDCGHCDDNEMKYIWAEKASTLFIFPKVYHYAMPGGSKRYWFPKIHSRECTSILKIVLETKKYPDILKCLVRITVGY